MLGRFLELSLVVPDTGTAWQRWLELGFADGVAGDVWPYPYGVVAAGNLAIGLHGRGDEAVTLTFVREDVAQLERELALRLIGVERALLDTAAFHLLELREPGGMLLRVLEARTFSPPAQAPASSRLGRFHCISLPGDLAEARGFWERLDFDVRDIESPWPGLAITGLPLACHDAADLRTPVLVFQVDGALPEPLREPGISMRPQLRALGARPHRVLRFAEGLAVVQLAPAD